MHSEGYDHGSTHEGKDTHLSKMKISPVYPDQE